MYPWICARPRSDTGAFSNEGLMEDVAELRKLAKIAREMADFAIDSAARERFTAAAVEYEERARISVDIVAAPSLVPALRLQRSGRCIATARPGGCLVSAGTEV